MRRPEDAGFLQRRRDAERVQQTVVVVGRAVLPVHRDVELVGAVDEIEAIDGESHLAVAAHRARRGALDVRCWCRSSTRRRR